MDFVSIPVLQTLLLAIMFLAVFVEIKTGGMGAGILLGLVAAGVFWGSQYVKGLVDLYQIAIFLAGILCIIVEMLLPTVGLLAGVGVAAMLYSEAAALEQAVVPCGAQGSVADESRLCELNAERQSARQDRRGAQRAAASWLGTHRWCAGGCGV